MSGTNGTETDGSEKGLPSVLVLDDDEGILEMIREILQGRRMKVKTAKTVSEARGLLREGSFDLAVLDVYIPDGTGIELAGEIKSEDPDFPVIVITAEPRSENVNESLATDVDGYLVKPIRVDSLIALSEELIRRYSGESKQTKKSPTRKRIADNDGYCCGPDKS